MQVKFDLKLSVYSLGLDICLGKLVLSRVTESNTDNVDLPLQVLIYYLNTITILDHKRIGLGEEPVKSELF